MHAPHKWFFWQQRQGIRLKQRRRETNKRFAACLLPCHFFIVIILLSSAPCGIHIKSAKLPSCICIIADCFVRYVCFSIVHKILICRFCLFCSSAFSSPIFAPRFALAHIENTIRLCNHKRQSKIEKSIIYKCYVFAGDSIRHFYWYACFRTGRKKWICRTNQQN